jgi:hypothetical protein
MLPHLSKSTLSSIYNILDLILKGGFEQIDSITWLIDYDFFEKIKSK